MRFESFAEFYPYYLGEHRNPNCRRLHFAGTTLVLVLLVSAVVLSRPALLWWLAPAGYGFAWIGHYFFEKNRPATFTYPFYSLCGDFVMYRDLWLGRISFKSDEINQSHNR